MNNNTFVVVDGNSSGLRTAGTSCVTPVFSTNYHENDSKSQDYKWNQNNSKILIDLYGKYKDKVGTFEIKSVKMMWDKISEEFKQIGVCVTPKNCLNRWRVLERNYKRFVDNQNKTGRGRKYFEYELEMGEIFCGKTNIHTKILLNSDTVDIIQNEKNDTVEEIKIENNVKPTTKRTTILEKKTTIEKFRLDRIDYYNKRLEIENQKLEEIRNRNNLIRERNDILKINTRCNHCNNNIVG